MKNESPTIMGFMTVLSMVFVSMVLVTSQTPAAFAGMCFEPGPDADCDGDGYTPNEGDCDENRSDIFPGQGCDLLQVVVGGEIIPIETTSLIVAGTQSFSWMIPIVLSILGIGIVIARKF